MKLTRMIKIMELSGDYRKIRFYDLIIGGELSSGDIMSLIEAESENDLVALQKMFETAWFLQSRRSYRHN